MGAAMMMPLIRSISSAGNIGRALRPAPTAPEGFSRDQLKKLVRDVDARHVHTREFDGKRLTYIEGWYAMAQANAIFGYAGWDREMVHFERVMERTKSDATIICGYMARVRIRVRAGSTEIVREGTGWGSASASTATAANERALKSAETDATKRALSTFGSRFGLSLYDKDHVVANQRPTFTLFTPDGRPLAENLSPESYSTGLRQLIELCKDTHQVDQLSRHNRAPLSEIRVQVPTLRNAQSVHFADLLLRLFQRRRERVGADVPNREGGGERSGENICTAGGNSLLYASSSDGAASSENRGTAACADDTGPGSSAGTGTGRLTATNGDGGSSNLPADTRTPTVMGRGDALRRYTGQSPRRRSPSPFPLRANVTVPKPSAVEQAPTGKIERVVEPVLPPSNEPECTGATVHAVARGMGSELATNLKTKDSAAEAETEVPQIAPNTSPPEMVAPTPGEDSVASVLPPQPDAGRTDGLSAQPPGALAENTAVHISQSPSKITSGLRIDKSKLWLGLERRIRDKNHLRQVAELPCLVCNRQPSHAHHLRFAQRRGLSQKVSDEYVVPLCALHHGDLHRSSSELDWWAKQRIDPLSISSELWLKNRRG